MDLFLIHCLLLLWTSIGTARQLCARLTDRLLAAGVIAWGNIVTTSLLLSTIHRLGEPAWFLGVSALLCVPTCLLSRHLPRESPPDVTSTRKTGAKLSPWLLGAFLLTLAPLACASIRIAVAYQPNNADALAYHLPRAMYYLGQGNLAPFDTADLRQILLPFNFNLLQLFGLIYAPPLQVLNFLNLAALVISGLAVFRLCRLCSAGPNPSLVATWLALIPPQVMAQSGTSMSDLPSAAALLCALVFAMQWKLLRLDRHARLAGLAIGLAVGSSLTILLFGPALVLLLWVLHRKSQQTGESHHWNEAMRAWRLPALLALLFGVPFLLFALADPAHWPESGRFLMAHCLHFADATGSIMRAFCHPWPLNSGLALDESHAGFGLAGLLILACALLTLMRQWENPGFVRWFAIMGLSWLVGYFLFQPASLNPGNFLPLLLVMTPCLSSTLQVITSRSSVLRDMSSALIALVLGITGWSSAKYLLHNQLRPLAPLLQDALVAPGLPSLPLLAEFHLKDQPWINIDSDARSESIFPFMVQGRAQRLTSGRQIVPGAYNLLSRISASRNAIAWNVDRPTAYALVSIPTKRTGGVEFLAAVGSGEMTRDYLGVMSQAGMSSPIESNQCIMVSFDFGPPVSGRDQRTLIRVAGLNSQDNARLTVSLVWSDRTAEQIATFKADDRKLVAITRPFRLIILRAVDATHGDEIGSSAIACPPQGMVASKPSDHRAAVDSHSIFSTDLVLSRDTRTITCDGLLPTEGPFPQWNLPFIRWQKQVSAHVRIPPTNQLARLKVSFSVQPQVRHAAGLDVLFNGKLVGHYQLKNRTVWLDQTLELTPQAGENVLEFRDATFVTEPDWLDYLERYPDVKTYLLAHNIPLEQGAREHYRMKGQAEGRTVRMRPTDQLAPPPDSYYFIYRSLRIEGFKSP